MSDKDLSVLFSLCGDRHKASSRVRGFWISEALEEEGVKCTMRWKQGKLALLRFAFDIITHDVVIFQKTYSRYHRWLMVLAIMLKKKSYLDIDDAPSKTQSPGTLKNIESMMQMADGIFAGSQKLFDYAKQYQANVHLIPSGINLKYYHVTNKARNSGPVCLGWIGNGAHYTRDLIDILEGPLRVLASQYDLRLKLVGACGVKELYDVFGKIPGLEIDFIDEIDWSDPAEVSKATQDFDIGLYPLLPNYFNQFKCGFKALEYMAIGIPVVSSSVAVNSNIIDSGINGVLVNSKVEWVIELRKLLGSGRLRLDMGKIGREEILASYNVNELALNISLILFRDLD